MQLAFAHSIPITQSSSMENVIFDGKWTFLQEWKQSSYDEIKTESEIIPLRTAHQGDFIYILIDVVPDITIDNNEDSTLVCFDAKNEKNTFSNDGRYYLDCRFALRGKETSEQMGICKTSLWSA